MKESRIRGTGLTIFLVLVGLLVLFATVGNLVIFFGHSAAAESTRAAYPGWALYTLAAIAILRFISVIAIWRWSRSGVVLFVGLTAIAIPICFSIGMQLSISGIFGVAILLYLVRNKWHQMQWGF